jgi:hypothetical protein
MTHPKQFLPILDELQFDGQPITNYRVCHGQILVDATFRKRGIALNLYTAFLDSARGRYDIRLTGVHKQNRISYNFHHNKLGMKTIGVFGEKGERQLLVLDMR